MSEEFDTKLSEMLDQLPEVMGKNNTGNEDVLSPAVDEVISVEQDTDDTYKATKVQLAPTTEEVDKHAQLVGVEQTQDEVSILRSKTLLGFAMNTTQGTVPQVLNQMSKLLGIPKEEIEYDNYSSENGVTRYYILESVFDGALSKSDIQGMFTEFVAAGYRVDILLRNSFETRTVTEYNNDPDDTNGGSKGYNGLDGSGNITTTGGKYTTLIN